MQNRLLSVKYIICDDIVNKLVVKNIDTKGKKNPSTLQNQENHYYSISKNEFAIPFIRFSKTTLTPKCTNKSVNNFYSNSFIIHCALTQTQMEATLPIISRAINLQLPSSGTARAHLYQGQKQVCHQFLAHLYISFLHQVEQKHTYTNVDGSKTANNFWSN